MGGYWHMDKNGGNRGVKTGTYNLNNRKLICGVGINDYVGVCIVNGRSRISYSRWLGILQRCYNNYTSKNAKYIGCTISDEWKRYSVFKAWFDEHYCGDLYPDTIWELDKDLLIDGNKVYSSDTVAIIPNTLNNLIHDSSKGYSLSNIDGLYKAVLYHNNGVVTIGSYVTVEEAVYNFKLAKDRLIRKVCREHILAYPESDDTVKVCNVLLERHALDKSTETFRVALDRRGLGKVNRVDLCRLIKRVYFEDGRDLCNEDDITIDCAKITNRKKAMCSINTVLDAIHSLGLDRTKFIRIDSHLYKLAILLNK